MEVRANAFAASFLMPAEGVRGYVNALSKGLGSRTRADTFDEEAVTRVEGRKRVDTQNIELHDVVRMAHHFGVSCTAMLYRLKGLDFVTEDERSSLAAQDSAGLSKALRGFLGLPEPVDSDGEMRVHARFVAMAIEAFTRGKITQCKLDELGSLVQARREGGAGTQPVEGGSYTLYGGTPPWAEAARPPQLPCVGIPAECSGGHVLLANLATLVLSCLPPIIPRRNSG